MKINPIQRIAATFFSSAEAGEALGLGPASARLACHRYVKAGYLIRPKRDIYITAERWKVLSTEGLFEMAGRLQVPSYVSFTTALIFYGVTTQIQQGVVECAAVKRTRTIEAGERTFRFFKMRKDLYFGFERKGPFFIAVPEKALLDACYLMSLGRYRLDLSAIDRTRVRRATLARFARRFSKKTQQLAEGLWKS